MEAGNSRREKRIRLLIILVSLAVFSFTSLGKQFWQELHTLSGFDMRPDVLPYSYVRVHVLDVGKADAIVLESREQAALLDAGTYADSGYIVDYLKRQGISRLAWAAMTHPDSDHVGGMARVLQEIPADEFIQGMDWEGTGQEMPLEYIDLIDQLRRDKVPSRIVPVGESFSLGFAQLEVVGPVREYEGTNSNSMVLRLTCFGFSALFCGDMEKKAELDLVESGKDIHASLLKVGHHGSRTSTTQELVDAVLPQVAVVSVGPDNNDLPRDEPLARLEAAGAQIFRTDMDGDLVFSFNGSDILVDRARGA